MTAPLVLAAGLLGRAPEAVAKVPTKTRDFLTRRSRKFHLFVGDVAVGQDWIDPFGIPHRVEFLGEKGVGMKPSFAGIISEPIRVPYTEMYRGWRQETTAGAPEEL